MISERLKSLREERNFLQKDVAKYLNISTSAYGYYEQGKRNPDTETINKIADLYQVSTDYLLGRTNNRNSHMGKETSLDYYNPNYLQYNELDKKIRNSLVIEGIVSEDKPVSKDMLEKVFKYGIDAAVEIKNIIIFNKIMV
ncbi:MAG: helix-turn-helix transcriptional regulator [Tissierellia bacterium]|nr:helix-turn-helix transcriptional regulator [Tissierellia bacterium]